MASNPTDETSDDCSSAPSSAPLAQPRGAVSPRFHNIVGGANRFNSTDETPPAPAVVFEGSEFAGDEAALSKAQGQPAVSPDSGERSQSTDLESEAFAPSQSLNLAEQYGTAGLLAELNALAETQRFHLEQHRKFVLRSRAEQCQQVENWKTRCAALEQQLQAVRERICLLEQRHLESQAQVLPLAAQCDAAQAQTQRLQSELLDRRQRQAEVEAQLELADETLHEQQSITAAQAQALVAMQAALSKAQAEVEALETRFSHQLQLRKQLREDGERDRQGRSKARDRQLQLEQETSQMTGQLLRLGEELRQAQQQSTQWRRQAQSQEKTLWDIAQWAAQADSVPAELMELLGPLLHESEETIAESESTSSPSSKKQALESIPEDENAPAVQPSQASSLDLPHFPSSST